MTRTAGSSRDVLAIRTLGLDWGVAGDDIEEVLPHRAAVRAPGSAPFVEGIVRYRDGILPVVDLSRRFRLPPGTEPPPRPRPEARRTLVVRISGGLAGLTVDEVVGSRPVGGALAPLPRLVTSPVVRGCLVGDDGDLLIVLDPRRILETDEPLDLPYPLGWRQREEEVTSSSSLPGAPSPVPTREPSGAPPSSVREPASPPPSSVREPAGPPPSSPREPAGPPPSSPREPAGTPPRSEPPRAAPSPPPRPAAREAHAEPGVPPVPPRAPADGTLDRPARPTATPAPPPAPPEAPPVQARPAWPEHRPGKDDSTLPDAPSPVPAREATGAPPGPAREPAGEPPSRRAPSAAPVAPPEPPARPPAAPPEPPARPPAAPPAAPAAPRPAARPGESRPAAARPPMERPAAAARAGGAGHGAPPGAHRPPARTASGASPDRPAEIEPPARRRPARWLAVAAALLALLGTGVVLATRGTREPPAVVAVRVPDASPPALPTAPLPSPARELPVAPPISAREPADGAPGSDRLTLTLEEQRAPGTGPEAGADGGETIEEVVEYTVVRGDTLWAIARRFTRNPFRYREIASDNDLRNPHLIFPGQQLTLRIRRLAPAPAPSP